MGKGYWISAYRKVTNPERLAQYSELAGSAISDGGGRILVRGFATVIQGDGIAERTVVVEFDSVKQAIDTFHGEVYQKALKILGDAVERDFRIVEGVN